MASLHIPAPISQSTHNEVLLTRDILITLLDDLSMRLLKVFPHQIQLLVHGGAVMILHPTLASSTTRRTTRDVDFIKRSFLAEMRKFGVLDAEARLQTCIDATAARYRLGKDWFNSDADIALPMAQDSDGKPYDPIYCDSVRPNNVAMNTIYSSPGLMLISVTMFWGVALKMVRYQKEDPADILAMLRHGTKLNGVQWTPQVLENWLLKLCWPMGYSHYPSWKVDEMRQRFAHAVELVQSTNQSRPLTFDPCYR